jgi:type I restriction enzyme S subunit
MIYRDHPPWSLVKLEDVGEVLIGLTYEPGSVSRSGTLVLRSSNIQDSKLVFDDNVYVDCPIPKRIWVRDQDILLCVRNGSRRLIGKSTLLDRRVVGQTFGAFMAVFRSNANPYLQYFFQSDDFRRQVDGHLGATINQITNRSLRSFVVALPGSVERQAVAERLGDADDLISKLMCVIAKKKAIKQGMMQGLLACRIRLPGFTARWSRHTLGELGSFLKGRGIRRDDVLSSGVSCIRYGELYTTYLGYTSTTVSFVADSVAAMALSIRPGDLLFAGSGETREEIGTCVAFTGTQRAVAGGDIVVLRARDVNPVYLASLTNTPRIAAQKARLGQGDAVVHINGRALSSIEVDLPPRDEQDAIADLIIDADNELRMLRTRLKKVEYVKQGMIQELLTGRTRLPVAETAAA